MFDVDYDLLEEARKNYKLLIRTNRTSQENIKNHVTVKILESLGYDSMDFDYESSFSGKSNKRVDISIRVGDDKIYIELKNGNKHLDVGDIEQLHDYLNKDECEWGILTNGRRIVLINYKINTFPNSTYTSKKENKTVFDIDIFKSEQLEYLVFLTKEAIFDTEVTNYFKLISQFKAIKYPDGGNSWKVYKGTLYNFFRYYSFKKKEFIPLEQIRINEFKDFLLYEKEKKSKINRKPDKLNTFANKYSHIRTMFTELKRNNLLGPHNFEEPRSKLLELFMDKKLDEDEDILSLDNIKTILDYLELNSENSLRDKLIFLLCVYMGLERFTLINLNKDNFDLKRKVIIIEEKRIPLPEILCNYVKELFNINKKNGIKGSYLFYSYYDKRYRRITESNMNDIFNKIKNIDLLDKKWTKFSPRTIRKHLIKQMFYNKYSIEQISYITGMNVNSISKIISQEDIISNVKISKRIISSHPFCNIIN
ncbi:tyrosine-type recombinase/integrase [Paramaledivibacter caminithermalis]|uniref:Type I restriction enzyme R protein N terminus (HSDR_N) n=1 Tax=Paramaledivibacter caminithermalis (strain DSM 15212 / CIP 107654 / DViRD3) TaxID=1121301 RepID=A0A1M6NB82_PARC5|nr:tyrosine-type recombinase/integrase [Paramaledivibacter caminithermalis]SHJ92955.1 Type I restriction enzyme R protein N terminus (HSDR_N) [Paramaledivibacter caminithermalis DSM 15212]